MRRWARIVAFIALAGLETALTSAAPLPERMILTGTPPFGPTWLATGEGAPIPAGCGPEAARILLAYYDRRYGYRFVGDDPGGAIGEIHGRMGTVTVLWGGVRQGLTWPWSFVPGLAAYVTARYPGGATIGTLDGDPGAAFARSVDLVRRGVPHVILFDWQGTGGIFPNHYAVVVGYDTSEGRRLLVLNPGWGYDFQLLNMSDPAVAPVTLFWIEEIRDPPAAEPGIPIGPPSGVGMWEVDAAGRLQFRPVLRLHHDPRSAVRWPASSQVEFLVPGADDLAIVTWDAH
ncbi:MAG: hypothetical protein AB7U87_02260 [Candidatus Bipolaricaulis sp.]